MGRVRSLVCLEWLYPAGRLAPLLLSVLISQKKWKFRPAFKNNMSNLPNRPSNSLPTLSTTFKSVRSHSTNSTFSATSPEPIISPHSSIANSNFSRLRASTTTCPISCRSSCLTISAPIPLCPPVIMAIFDLSGGHSESVHLTV